MEFHADLTRDKFLIEWFGTSGGRILGTKGKNQPFNRSFIDDPEELVKFVDEMKRLNLPAWMSVQPFENYETLYGMERVFFDFDDPQIECPECKKIYKSNKVSIIKKNGGLCPKCNVKPLSKPRLDLVAKDVSQFIKNIHFRPLITKTFKGYHIWGFLNPLIIESDEELLKEIYATLMSKIIKPFKYFFLDTNVVKDIKRVGRIPLSWHEKGIDILPVNERLRPTKIRSVDFYKQKPISPEYLRDAIRCAIKSLKKKKIEKTNFGLKYQNKIPTQGEYNIRPCFEQMLSMGEAEHQQRLAWLIEIYHSGYNTPEKMLALCKKFKDYDRDISMKQIEFFFKKKEYKRPPYRCVTLKKYGWCLENNECPIYKRRWGDKGYKKL